MVTIDHREAIGRAGLHRDGGEDAGAAAGGIDLSDYAGKVLLIVNVASKCGFTPQYEGLEALHRRYADRGFEVLGFPCNQFGAGAGGRGGDREFLLADL